MPHTSYAIDADGDVTGTLALDVPANASNLNWVFQNRSQASVTVSFNRNSGNITATIFEVKSHNVMEEVDLDITAAATYTVPAGGVLYGRVSNADTTNAEGWGLRTRNVSHHGTGSTSAQELHFFME